MLAFLEVSKIQYNPKAPADDVMVYRHYNASEVNNVHHYRSSGLNDTFIIVL